ncbi:pyrophosphatase PpaX [Virgibacillus dakarensis]|uniref:Pyrophosphatase PpaX n=1 Tax=Lentibacillus populi TaxID=1827502 RepID=A0A9W5TZQ9_9BACI|nr:MULTISPECIES: pyrophosphatase PpaX [Bacillaceae]MBT2216134.1 pyrophosphatase PpaX [Virgibacillus dakarensis]MTW86350.1 pyrophosphatase PpaX [Virgibacillus dakarensis]GGB53921.1 pyrophosphatase PpaX [Lentibacillus populi]
MSIHTILFDLDGTLIDTNELIIASFEHTFHHYGKPFSREKAIEFIGPPLKESFQQIDPAQVNAMIATYREHNLQHHDEYVTAFPYVVETLTRLKKHGLQLGIVTTKMRHTVNKGLKLTAIDHFFETIITLDDVTHAKPHPEPIVKAMSNLSAQPETTLMVGDNSHDIEAGQNAGVATAAVAWSLRGKEELLAYNPTYMLDDIRDLLTIIEV